MRVLAELVTVVVGLITIFTFVARYLVRRRRLEESLRHEDALRRRGELPPGDREE